MIELTDRQQEIYEYVQWFIDEIGYPPSNKDVAEYFEFRSVNAAQCHLKALEAKGYINIASNIARGITIL